MKALRLSLLTLLRLALLRISFYAGCSVTAWLIVRKTGGIGIFRSGEFVVAYFGLLLGVTLTVVSLIAPALERLSARANRLPARGTSSSDAILSHQRAQRLLRELKHDVLFVFGSFVTNLFIVILSDLVQKGVFRDVAGIFLAIGFIQLATILSSLVAIYDLIMGLLLLTEACVLLAQDLHENER